MSLWHPTRPFHSHPAASGFGSLFRLLDDFDKYAQHQVGPTLGGNGGIGTLQTFSPKFDVTEHEKEYVLQGELPGVSPENVEIEFTDPQTLVIKGHSERTHTEGDPSLARLEGGAEKQKIEGKAKETGGAEVQKAPEGQGQQAEDAQGPKYWLSERSYGEFSRVFSFPTGVDQDGVEAKFNNGVLDIKVPKQVKKGTRKIQLK
ncbi:30 kDa heat shock protein [Cercophora scortea]|uniref:30 kDa heat shock protein n=1 Tax=Cercophora scortea TaxID=314031 RepID=A0AAE0MDE8_9PEZI|nr:30 kDa heat shock protein [Cercophora scortea]